MTKDVERGGHLLKTLLTWVQLQFSQDEISVARKLISFIFCLLVEKHCLTFNQYFIHLLLPYIIDLWQSCTLPDTLQCRDNQDLIKPDESICQSPVGTRISKALL